MARFSNPFIQYQNAVGSSSLPGATLDFFAPGTTTPKNTFSDSGLTTANPNPVVADGSGVMPDIFLDGTYKVVLKDADGVIQPEGTKDPVGEVSGGQFELWLNDNTYNIPDIVAGSDDNFYRSLVDANQGNDPTSSAAQWEQIDFERIFNVNVTYGLGDRTIGSDGMEYFSLVAANLNNNPVTDASSTNWRAADQLRSADAGGTVDAITATYIPAVGALKDELVVRARALGANATTTPTFAPNGLAAKTIVKNGNQALVAGDILAADHEMILVYNSTSDNWELLNPASVGADIDLSNLTSTGEQKIAKTWANIDGTGTVSLRDSFNVAGLVDLGVGTYQINHDVDMANALYVVATSGARTGSSASTQIAVPTDNLDTGAFRMVSNGTGGSTPFDADVHCVVFGDQ